MSTGNTPTQPSILANLVEYQDGSVVSRTLIKRPSGSVTVFAFDEGQELSEHKVPYDAFVYLVVGKARITLSGKPHELGVGDALVMPARTPHAVVALTQFKMVLAMVRADEDSQT